MKQRQEDTSTDFEWGSDSVPEKVVAAVSRETGVDPMEMEQLADRIDPDALDLLFANGRDHGSVTFPFAGCDVTVYAHGEITVRA